MSIVVAPGAVRITALRAQARGRVAVELDGAPWRTLPLDVVVRAGLTTGEVGRNELRTLARELRRSRALLDATRALRARDLSTRAIEERLARRGHAPGARADAVTALAGAGFLDDTRIAEARARTLAARGYGNAAILADLRERGIGDEPAAAAVALLEPEQERSAQIVERRGAGPATARLLARRGFDPEVAAAAAGVEEA